MHLSLLSLIMLIKFKESHSILELKFSKNNGYARNWEQINGKI
jgi:hypothetical protein